MADLPIPFLGRFYQRVLILGFFILIIIFLVFYRAYFLVQNYEESSFIKASSRLERRQFPDSYRGKILLENGTVIAQDKPGWDIAVAWEMIEDGISELKSNNKNIYIQNSEQWSWVYRRAKEKAIKKLGRNSWLEKSNLYRENLINELMDEARNEWNNFWSSLASVCLIDNNLLDAQRKLVEKEVEKMATQVYKEQYRRHQAKDPGGQIGIKFRSRKLKEHIEHHVVIPDISDEVAINVQQYVEKIESNSSKLFKNLVKVNLSRSRAVNDPLVEIQLPNNNLPFNLRNKFSTVIKINSPLNFFIGKLRPQVSREAYLQNPFVSKGKNDQRSNISLTGYKVTDEFGIKGLEASQENWLRGRRGARLSLKYGLKNQLFELEKKAVPGSDIVLTIDRKLQGGLQAIISSEFGLTRVQKWHSGSSSGNTKFPLGTSLNAAAVVVEISSGRCLAAASNPMSDQIEDTEYTTRKPWLNRAIEGVYAPGSVIKPLILAAAMAENIDTVDYKNISINCNGHYFPNNKNIARCWLYADKGRTHGTLDAAEAIARSCNIYFFELANSLGHEKVIYWLKKFGFGTKTNCGIGYKKIYNNSEGKAEVFMQGGEAAGGFQSVDSSSKAYQAVITGIGQGISVTPLQIAKAYATLLRKGKSASVAIIKGGSQLGYMDNLIPLQGISIELILKGMSDSINKDYGTAKKISFNGSDHNIFDLTTAKVWAKTGTAQTGDITRDLNNDGIKERYTGLTHAWTVALAGKRDSVRPTHVVVVLVEHGGSGGRVAGPIASEIIRYLNNGGWL